MRQTGEQLHEGADAGDEHGVLNERGPQVLGKAGRRGDDHDGREVRHEHGQHVRPRAMGRTASQPISPSGTSAFVFRSTNATPPSLSTFLLQLMSGTQWHR